MSDVAETTATEVHDTTVDTAVETAQPVAAESLEGLTPKERARARGRALDEARAATAEKAERAREQFREGGRFAKAEESAAVAAGVSESESPVAKETAPEEDGGPAEGFERVFYPEGHPLRDQGVTYDDVPVASAARIKALLNGTYHRRQDVEQAQQRAAELEDRLARMEAENRFRGEHGAEFWTAEDQAFYDDAKEHYGEEFAERYRKSKIAEAQEAIGQATDEAQLQAVAQRIGSHASEFKNDALSGLPRMYPGLTAQEVDTAIAMYAHELDQVQAHAIASGMTPIAFFRKFGGYNETDFFAVAKDYIESRPGVIARRTSQSQASEVERNRIKAEIEAQQRKDMQDASRRHAQNPNRNLGGGSIAPTSAEDDGPPDLRGKSLTEIKKGAKQRVIERFRRQTGG